MPDASADMEFSFVEHEGLRIRIGRYRSQEEAPTLLFLSGIGLPMEAAMPFFRALRNRPVISLDIPGVGKSTTPRRPYRLSTLAALIAQLLDKLGIACVDLLGVSWGGALAQQFARDFPERCRKLILAATSPGAVMVPGRPAALMQLARPGSALVRQAVSLLMPQILDGLKASEAGPYGEHRPAPEPKRKRGYLYQLMAISGWTSIHWLHRLKMPTLILMGSEDPIVPLANGHLLSKCIPGSTLHTFPGGHLFMLEHPERVALKIEQFLTSTD